MKLKVKGIIIMQTAFSQIMSGVMIFFLVITESFANFPIETATGKYVCFDGRSLSRSEFGFVWDAKRGCFRSHLSCRTYQAQFYGCYGTTAQQTIALQTCRDHYPYHLGEMQTH